MINQYYIDRYTQLQVAMMKNYGFAFSVGAAIPLLLKYVINNVQNNKEAQKWEGKRFVGI